MLWIQVSSLQMCLSLNPLKLMKNTKSNLKISKVIRESKVKIKLNKVNLPRPRKIRNVEKGAVYTAIGYAVRLWNRSRGDWREKWRKKCADWSKTLERRKSSVYRSYGNWQDLSIYQLDFSKG